jgi:hypothetical protein
MVFHIERAPAQGRVMDALEVTLIQAGPDCWHSSKAPATLFRERARRDRS